MRLGTQRTATRLVERYASVVQTDQGEPVQGLEVLMTGPDREAFNVDMLDLTEVPDLDPLIRRVEQLRTEIEANLEE
jgi:hypothetical protein